MKRVAQAFQPATGVLLSDRVQDRRFQVRWAFLRRLSSLRKAVKKDQKRRLESLRHSFRHSKCFISQDLPAPGNPRSGRSQAGSTGKVGKKEIRDAIGEQGVVRWTLEQGDATMCLKGKKLVKRHFVFRLKRTG